MKLNIVDKEGKQAVTVQKLLCIQKYGKNIELNGIENTIKISSDKKSRKDWYSSFIHKKELAMYSGGIVREYTGGEINDEIKFKVGIKIYTHNTTSKEDDTSRCYIKSICGATVNPTSGNLQLLPGRMLDVLYDEGAHEIPANHVVFKKLRIESNDDAETRLIEDMRVCVWYLYHTFNSFIYRMSIWDPSKKTQPMFTNRNLLGVVENYQATVAAWNIKVWRKSFLWEISPIRESISFSIGYTALACKNASVVCRVTILNSAPVNDTTKFFTVYDQGISTNKTGSITRTIVKKTDGGDITIDGAGSDEGAEKELDWSSIIIETNISALEQGDYYRASFALSVAQNEATAFYYQQAATELHSMEVVTEWIVDGETFGFVTPISIPALLLYEDADNFINEYKDPKYKSEEN